MSWLIFLNLTLILDSASLFLLTPLNLILLLIFVERFSDFSMHFSMQKEVNDAMICDPSLAHVLSEEKKLSEEDVN